MTWFDVEITANVALLDTMVSAALFKYGTRLRMVFTPAGAVIIGGGTALVDVAGALTDEVVGPMTVTRTVTV